VDDESRNRHERRHPEPPLLYDVPAACQQLGGISKNTLYRLVAAGQLQLVKIGRRSYLVGDDLDRYARSLAG
jgi:excisionase family DNA binding protein